MRSDGDDLLFEAISMRGVAALDSVLWIPAVHFQDVLRPVRSISHTATGRWSMGGRVDGRRACGLRADGGAAIDGCNHRALVSLDVGRRPLLGVNESASHRAL